MTQYNLAMCKSYVAHWGVTEAVRELIQNALDSDSPFEYEFKGGTLKLHSRNTCLHPRTLLMGLTTKAEGDAHIGSFGEGYKLALLVLTRCERPVKVYNEDQVWTADFKWLAQYEEEVLRVSVRKPRVTSQKGLTFAVHNLSEEEIKGIIESCLHMQPPPDAGRVRQTPTGSILMDKPGKLYVGGLYICDTSMAYGYDVKPEFITLGRDRRTVDGWDLQWITKDMWFALDAPDEVAGLMQEDIIDLKYAGYNTPEVVRDACYRLFQERYAGKLAVKTQWELDALVKQGMTEVVIVKEAFHVALTESAGYKKDAPFVRPPPTPQQQMRFWFTANKKGMNAPARCAFERLMKRAEEWRAK